MKEFWTYTGLRIALFLASAAVVWGVYALVADTINLLVVLLVAAVISSLASWKLLAGPRERLATNVNERAARAAARFEETRAKEDAEAEAAEAAEKAQRSEQAGSPSGDGKADQ